MAAKTANVLARVEPHIKEQAESIMAQLGIPASVVINMLYKQIIITKGIPFNLTVPNIPSAREEMDTAAFNSLMQRGHDDAKADRSYPVSEVFSELRREIDKASGR